MTQLEVRAGTHVKAEIGGFVAQLEHVIALRIGGCKRQKRITREIWNNVFALTFAFFSLFPSSFNSVVREGTEKPSVSDLYTTDWSESMRDDIHSLPPSLESE